MGVVDADRDDLGDGHARGLAEGLEVIGEVAAAELEQADALAAAVARRELIRGGQLGREEPRPPRARALPVPFANPLFTETGVARPRTGRSLTT